jgi:hypothetical protein
MVKDLKVNINVIVTVQATDRLFGAVQIENWFAQRRFRASMTKCHNYLVE